MPIYHIADDQKFSKERIVADAAAFANNNEMSEHAALFGRAGLVARDMDNFEEVSELLPEEREALIYERDHKWHGPKMLWYSVMLCATGAATQGMSRLSDEREIADRQDGIKLDQTEPTCHSPKHWVSQPVQIETNGLSDLSTPSSF